MNQFKTIQKTLMTSCETDPRFNSLVYANANLAASDFFFSIKQHMPHKSSIAFLTPASSHFDLIKSLCIKNDMQTKIKTQSESTISFLQSLDASNTLFVYWSLDHELTGERIYSENQEKEITDILKQKRLTSFKIHQYFNLKTETENIHQFEMVYPDLFRSDRFACQILYSKQNKMEFIQARYQHLEGLKWPLSINSEKTIKFKEAELERLNYFSRFSAGQSIVSDRIVLCLEKISSLMLKEYLKLDDTQAFSLSEIPEWELATWKDWWPEVENRSLQRGLLILNKNLFNDEHFEKKLLLAIQYLDENSQWIVKPHG